MARLLMAAWSVGGDEGKGERKGASFGFVAGGIEAE